MFKLYQNSYQKREQLRKLMDSEEWPQAIDDSLIYQDPTERAHAILSLLGGPDVLPGTRLLDFGCGSGEVVKVSSDHGVRTAVGYDIIPKEGVVTHFEEVRSKGPYDVVIVNDVLDHLVGETIKGAMEKIASVTVPFGHILVRCHPYISRTGTHLPQYGINKAYAHLVLPNLEGDYTFFTRVPIQIYQEAFAKNHLQVDYKLFNKQVLEDFFFENEDINHILGNVSQNDQMQIQNAEYVLRKV